MKANYILASILVSIAAIACSKSAKSKKLIQNSSSYSIKVSIFDKSNSNKLYASHQISANGQVVIEDINSKSGPRYNGQQSCVNPNDSIALEVIDNAGLKASLDLNNSTNWEYSRVSANSSGTEDECKAMIDPSEIVSK